MVSELGELIARYEAAHERVMEVVKNRPDSDAELIKVDQDLSAAFNAILDYDPVPPKELVDRVRFLLDHIKSNQSGNELVEQLVNRIWLDVVESGVSASVDINNQTDKMARQTH